MTMTTEQQADCAEGKGDAGTLLRQLLGAEPSLSRAVVERMTAAGFTPKQIRGARSRLGVHVTRTGTGASTRSYWTLPGRQCPGTAPDGDQDGRTAPGEAGQDGPERSARAHTRARGSGSSTRQLRQETSPKPSLSPGELSRLEGRTATLAQRGMDSVRARKLAMRLTLERDRTGLHATGSCIECQVRAECPSVRPWEEIHQCWQRRVDCP